MMTTPSPITKQLLAIVDDQPIEEVVPALGMLLLFFLSQHPEDPVKEFRRVTAQLESLLIQMLDKETSDHCSAIH